jgi:hypothetical protein
MSACQLEKSVFCIHTEEMVFHFQIHMIVAQLLMAEVNKIMITGFQISNWQAPTKYSFL